MNSLCVCFTPLNVLIARRVAEINNTKFSKGVFITSVDTEKQRYYANVMQEFCESVDYLIVATDDSHFRPRHLSILFRRIKYRKLFQKYSPLDAIYVAASYNDYLFELLSGIDFKHFYTFDDGLVNIYDDGTLIRHFGWRAKIFLKLAGVKYWPARIRETSELHYTIYKAKHSFSKTQFVELTPATKSSSRGAEVKKIFLGALPEASEEMWRLIRNSVNEIKPHGYLAHPREKIKKIENVEYINTPLVAEDYVLTEMENNSNLFFEVYGYDSSALFNLAKVHGVKVISVLPNNPENAALRNLMQVSGIDFLN
jgi:N-acetyllactosaminide alpha-2,3-sialyltransferase